MTCITYSVGGVLLDDPGRRWTLLRGTLVSLSSSIRTTSMNIPGVDGSFMGGDEALDEAALVLKIKVRGSDYGELVRNFSALSMVIGTVRDTEVVRTVEGNSLSQLGRGKTIDAPDFSASARSYIFNATMRLPSVYWRGKTETWLKSGVTNGKEYEVTTLSGSTGPINDALLLITGPVNQPRVTCGDQWVELGLSLTPSQKALINCDTWEARVGSGVTFNGGGMVRSGTIITSGGPNLLSLQPQYRVNDPTKTSVKVALSGASGITSATSLSIRGRSAHRG